VTTNTTGYFLIALTTFTAFIAAAESKHKSRNEFESQFKNHQGKFLAQEYYTDLKSLVEGDNTNIIVWQIRDLT
jgi:hypothetical protein